MALHCRQVIVTRFDVHVRGFYNEGGQIGVKPAEGDCDS